MGELQGGQDERAMAHGSLQGLNLGLGRVGFRRGKVEAKRCSSLLLPPLLVGCEKLRHSACLETGFAGQVRGALVVDAPRSMFWW